MIDSLIDFLGNIAINVISRLPTMQFDLVGYMEVLNQYLPGVNYFIPFNELSYIFITWIDILSIAISIYALLKFIIGVVK